MLPVPKQNHENSPEVDYLKVITYSTQFYIVKLKTKTSSLAILVSRPETTCPAGENVWKPAFEDARPWGPTALERAGAKGTVPAVFEHFRRHTQRSFVSYILATCLLVTNSTVN